MFYALEFNMVPCVSFIGDLDTSKACSWIRDEFRWNIKSVYQHSFFDHTAKDMFFNNSIFVLNEKRMIELGNNYCHVLHSPGQYGWANTLILKLAEFRMVNDEKVIGFTRQSTMN
jgi:hypothetical protein